METLRPLVDFGERTLCRRLMDSFLDDIRYAESEYRGGLKTEQELIDTLGRILQNIKASSTFGVIQRALDHCELVMLDGLTRDVFMDPPSPDEVMPDALREDLEKHSELPEAPDIAQGPRQSDGTRIANSSSNSKRTRNRNEIENNAQA